MGGAKHSPFSIRMPNEGTAEHENNERLEALLTIVRRWGCEALSNLWSHAVGDYAKAHEKMQNIRKQLKTSKDTHAKMPAKRQDVQQEQSRMWARSDYKDHLHLKRSKGKHSIPIASRNKGTSA